MTFILVQHLDPTHESLMSGLLASHTSMRVQQAADGMVLERDHLYVIPPATYLSVQEGVLVLSPPLAPHGARLPFDFLLHSLAEQYGAHAICVVLSGTGADGSLGLKAVNKNGGLVIAQDPDEATYDGMPRNAIMTGVVDLVLPVAQIPDALRKYASGLAGSPVRGAVGLQNQVEARLQEVIELLRTKTPHDFTLYKHGTLQRRIERRMAMISLGAGEIEEYLKILRSNPNELDLLGKDLLINVTEFFRDQKVFDHLAKKIVPDLVRNHPPDRPIRIWVAGCSTGEETYSLTMLFREEIASIGRNLKLQVFASDVDTEAVASAREGYYSEAIEKSVSASRLARFFSKEEHGYRVLPELRASIVFTVQDVLADPPFSRLDMVSCRNLLIYLRPEAQTKVISRFHFALRENAILLLGSSEAIGSLEGRFAVVSKAERLYKRIGRSRPGDVGFSIGAKASVHVPARPEQNQLPAHQATLGEYYRRLIMETYEPAAVLINQKMECLYSQGPTDRYLHLAAGLSTHDLLALANEGMRNKLRAAIQQANQEKSRVVLPGGRAEYNGSDVSFRIEVSPVHAGNDDLLLICFVDEPKSKRPQGASIGPGDPPRVAELERELDIRTSELLGAIRSLEISSEEQKAINEEALSLNEEFQTTNEELSTSKEELQSLNEELTALNSQLQETLEHQRTTANDLQNVLYSTALATLFLDMDLNIRFFTPATKLLFHVIPGDVGRPLADLSSLAVDGALQEDARMVLQTLSPIEREVETQDGVCFVRRILPYRTSDNGVEGVVITFTDITERKKAAKALEIAKQEAEVANLAKSRFLAAASHDLRQPLQTLALLQGLLAKKAQGEAVQNLVGLLDQTLGAMSGMLNTLLDINQIDAGAIHAEVVNFPISDLLSRLKDEFTYHAESRGLKLRVVPCSLCVASDPLLLEQMIRNLLSNAMKYTKEGRVLLGCRRRGEVLSIEIWDTGIGIPDGELKAIFAEYHQLDNAARERGRGLGLGLSIVQRLGALLSHKVGVRSQPGKGSVFNIEVMLRTDGPPGGECFRPPSREVTAEHLDRSGSILAVEDEPELRDLLQLLLKEEGHHTMVAGDGPTAIELVERGTIRPDLVLVDYNLPNGLNGIQVTQKIREILHREIPAIILTGDISTDALRDISLQDCVQLNKPVKVKDLTQVIRHLLPVARPRGISVPHSADAARPTVFVVDDDETVCAAMRVVLEADGKTVETYSTGEAFLETYHPGREECLLVDAYLPGISGLELLQRLTQAGYRLPAIMITGNGEIPMAVQAMQAGAMDFIEKPMSRDELLTSIGRALDQSRGADKLSAWRETAAHHIAGLTPREREIMRLVLAGHPSKNIAADLGISQRTVENHRASIMAKTGSKSLPALARFAIAAAWIDVDDPPVQNEPPATAARLAIGS